MFDRTVHATLVIRKAPGTRLRQIDRRRQNVVRTLKKVAHEAIAESVTDYDILCDLLLNRRTATWNPLVLYNKEAY